MKRTLFMAMLFTVYVFCFASMSGGFSTDAGGHLTITDEAAIQEKSKKSGDYQFMTWLDGTVNSPSALLNFLTGVRDEDCTPINLSAMQELPIDEKWPVGPNGWGNFFEHFFNPRTGAGLGSNRTAIARAEEYERKIKSFICGSSSRYDQLSEPSKKKVNDYFGRIQHLLQDMGMSYHTKLEVHPFQVNKPLENYVETNWETIKTSDLFKEELLNANYSTGRCIDPTVPMFRLAQWSNDLPPNHSYWEFISSPSEYYELLNDKVAHYATRMSARATKFTEGYIDQIWRAINSDCICEPPVSGPGVDHPDDTFTVSGSFLGTTQLDLSASAQLDFFMRLALKKGDMSPVYTKQLMDIYAEAQALPPGASQEAKDEIQTRFQAFLVFLNSILVRNQDEWPDIALLENGFHDEALSLFNKAKEPVRLVSSDFTPSLLESQPILVIPSGGLMGLEKSTFFKASLDEYVKNGGTLIVFGQQHGYQFSVLPVPDEQDGTINPITGYGWDEDQNCFTDAVYLNTYHQMFSGQSRTTPTLNVDGYFAQYPSNATILLTRTANGQPAMLMYEYGQGRVIVTSLYADFTLGQSQASREEISLIRDMISWAKKPAVIPETRRNETVSLTLNIVNVADNDASSVKLLIYSPDRKNVLSEQTITERVPAHGSTQVAMQYTASTNAQLGIYHIDYVLLDTQGVAIQPQTETDSGRFVVSNPPKTGTPDKPIWFSITTDSQEVFRRFPMNYQFHIYNNTSQTRNLTIRSAFGHTGQPHTWNVVVGPNSETIVSGSDPFTDSFWFETLRASLHDESGQEIGRYQLTFRATAFSGSVAVTTDKLSYRTNESASIGVVISNGTHVTPEGTLTISVRSYNGREVFRDERLIALPANGNINVYNTFPLAETLEAGPYYISTMFRYESAITWESFAHFELLKSQITVVPEPPSSYTVGINTISFIIRNTGRISVNAGTLNIRVQDPEATNLYTGSYPFTLFVGEERTITFPVPISQLMIGAYTLTYTQSDETRTGSPVRMVIPNTATIALTLDKPSYRARETVAVSAAIVNTGKFDLNDMAVTITIPDAGYSETISTCILAGQKATVPFSFTIPNTIAPDFHTVSAVAVLPSGMRVTQTGGFNVPQSSLIITFPGPRLVTSGSTIQLMVENIGGADTNYTSRISIRDSNGTVVYEGNVANSVIVGEKKVLVDIPIPPQAAQGKNDLIAEAQDHTSGSVASLRIILDVTGITAGLQTRSSKDVYLGTEPITAISDILNGAYGIDSGNLKITVDTISGLAGFTHVLPKNGWMEVSPRAVAVGSDGSVYISEACRILHFDTMWNLMDEWGSCGSDNGQFSGATHLAVGADGSVYIADTGNHRIQRFTADGVYIQEWGSQGTNNGQFLYPSGVAVTSEGSVYVADTNTHRIQMFSADGTFITKWQSYGTGDGEFIGPAGIAVGPYGSIYVADSGNHRIQRFSADGAFITKWGSEGSGDGQFFRPYAIAIGSEGSVYVGNSGRIQMFTAGGAFIDSVGSYGTDQGQFLEIAAVAVAPDGTIYAVDRENEDVQRFDSRLEFIAHWGSHGNQHGWFYHPSYVASSTDGSLYVSDADNHRIQKFDRNGDFITSWGSEGSDNGEFFRPAGIAIGPEGSIFVADYFNHRIQKFDSEGRFERTWGSAGSGDGQFSYPDGIAVSREGMVYVADRVNGRIQKFNSGGTFINKWSAGMPEGIAVGPDGMVYVFDFVYSPGWSKRIQKFDSNGTYLLEWEWWSMTDSGGIAVDEQGFVYLANGIFIHKFDSNGNYIEEWEAPGECTGLVVTTDGTVYCADSNLSRILKCTPRGATTVFERNIPATLTAHARRQELTSIGVLEEPGKYFLHATLTNRLGQRLAQSEYSFYVAKENSVLTFSTEKKIYRPGETVTIRGEAQNHTSVAAQGLAVAMNQQGTGESQSLYTATFDLGANSTYPLTVTTQAGSDGIYVLTGTLNHANTTVFEGNDRYEVATPNIVVHLMTPNTAGIDVFTITLELRNEGKIDSTVTVASPFDTRTLTIPAGTQTHFSYPPQQITEDTMYTFILSGDVNQSISRTVAYGLAASLAANVLPIYPEGNMAIPISVHNSGNLDENFTVEITLQPTGVVLQKAYFIPSGQSVSDTLFFSLTEGDYTLTLTSQSPPANTSVSFSVRKELKVTMTPIVIGAPTGGLIPVSTEIVNTGAADIEGTVQMSFLNSQGALVWQANQAVSIPVSQTPTPVPISFSFSPAALQPASYTVSVVLLNNGGQELASQNMPLTITGGNLRISQMPSPQTVNAGADATFLFKVANTGGREASAELTLKSHDFINLTRRELINPGEVKDIQFAFPIPSDLEEKDYFADYEMKSAGTSIAKGQIKYHVAGINIGVTASLNKEHYRDGETVYLNLVVNQQGGGSSQNLFARVNYAGYEDKQSFVLSGSQNLSFNIPLTAINGEKLFYGIYDEGGRSIHLNSLYIYKTGDVITITNNKQVYNPGETVTINIAGNATGTMTLSAPGPYEETFSFSGSTTKGFVLPTVATAGTYFIEARLATASGETVTAGKPFDIAGISVKVKEALLDKGKYLPGDTLRLSMRIESNIDMLATLKLWSVDPEKNSTLIGERPLSLTRAELVTLSSDFPTTITSSGIHKVIYGIYSDRLLLSSGNLSFDAGDAVTLGIATDRNNYPLGSEAVAVRFNLYGRSDATLILNMNGATVHSESISLNGFTPMTIQLSTPAPGVLTLEGILTAGGLSSKKETKFLYGTNLPDLAADVWGSGTAIGKDGTLKLIATAGNRGKTAATPTSMTLHNGNDLLATFTVGDLAAGASQSYEYLWNVLGKAGEHTLVAMLDPGSSLTEFTKENNRATRRIVVPNVALITETEKESYRTGEQVTIIATAINLTAGTSYPNLTCTTIIRDPAGAEFYRQSSTFSLPPYQSALTSVTWNTGSVTTEGRYTIRQEIASGTTILAEKTKTVTIAAGIGFGLRVEPASLRIKQGMTGLFTASVDAPAGSTGSVTLGTEGLLAGVTTNFSPTIVNPPGISNLSINTTAAIPPGTYPIYITGEAFMGGERKLQITPVTLEVSGFTLQAEPESIPIAQQETADFTVRAASMNGYEGTLVLSDATGGIGGLIVNVANPNLVVPGGETAVRVQSSKYSPPGTYTIKISGNDGIITKDVNLPVVVAENSGIAPGFVMTPGPGYNNRALVTLMSRNFVEQMEFTAFNTRFGANAVMGDIDGDGEDEIIVAPGPDPTADGRIKVFRKNGTLLLEQPVFTAKSGATLAIGDIDGDWREEIVVGAGPGLKNLARIKVLSFDGQRFVDTGIDFVAFPNLYKLGVKLALGDVDGDGVLEIITGAGPSLLNPARVKVFKIDTSGGLGHWRIASTLSDFIVNFGDRYPYLFGVNVAAGDVDGDGMAEIIVGAGPGPLQKAVVAVYKGDGTFTGTRFEAYPSNDYRFGVNVTARDLDGDGIAEIITGLGPSPFHGSWVRVFSGDGTPLSDGFLVFPEAMKFGVKVSTGSVGE